MKKHQTQPDLVFGTQFGSGKEVVLSGTASRSHLFALGTTGSGKSRFLASLIVQLINQGISVIVLDPHSDLAELVLGFLYDTGYFTNPQAFQRVRYLDFSGQSGRYPPMNVLSQTGQGVHEVARWVWTAMSRAWAGIDGGQAPMMEQAMLSGIVALSSNNLPLTELSHLFTDPIFREQLLRHVRDDQVQSFFAQVAAKRGGMLSESALRRAFLLSFSPAQRASLGAKDNLFDLRSAMDQGISLLVDLGSLDEETQRMLGCLITVACETAALSRANVPEKARRPATLILDEYSMFAAQSDESLERMLALCRKYGLSVILACQSLGQARKLRSALQNCLPIVMRVGNLDSDWAASVVGSFDSDLIKSTATGTPTYISRGEQQTMWAERLERLPSRHAVVRLGEESIPFYTLGLPEPRCSRTELERIKTEYARLFLRMPQEETPAVLHAPPPRPALPPPEAPSGSQRRGVNRRRVPLDKDA
jgi:hypothetical protein